MSAQICCRYYPCTVPWFLARCELQVIRKGWRRRVSAHCNPHHLNSPLEIPRRSVGGRIRTFPGVTGGFRSGVTDRVATVRSNLAIGAGKAWQ